MPLPPSGITFAPGLVSTAASGSADSGRAVAQTPMPSAKAAASAAAAATGAAHERRFRNGITFGRSARACSRMLRFSSGGGSGPVAP